MNPIRPAERTANITYAVRDIVVLAKEVAKTRDDMLYLNIGDPNIYDFKTPPHMVEAVAKAMRVNHCGYAPSSGIPEAIDAVAAEAAKNGIHNILDIFITTGGSEAIELCLTGLVNRGENVLTPYPGYPLYDAVIAKLEAVFNPYYLDEENDWQPDLDDILSKVNPKTRAIILINPNNPTGSVCNRDTLQGIIKIAREYNLVIFADEIYDKLILDDDKRHISIASLDPEASVITFNGLAKGYLAPGFRIGWGIVSGRRDVMGPYIDAINKMLRARLCANHPMQYAVKPALQGDQSHLTEVKDKLRRRRDLTFRMLNGLMGSISCVKPAGAFYAFPRINTDKHDTDFVKSLLRETGVVVVPGSGFGQKPGSQHFRVVFLPQEYQLEAAYQKILDHFCKFTGLKIGM